MHKRPLMAEDQGVLPPAPRAHETARGRRPGSGRWYPATHAPARTSRPEALDAPEVIPAPQPSAPAARVKDADKAREIIERAEAEAELIRREAHVTAQGIREIAREDAKNLQSAVEFFGLTVELNKKIAKLERAIKKQNKLLKKLAREK